MFHIDSRTRAALSLATRASRSVPAARAPRLFGSAQGHSGCIFPPNVNHYLEFPSLREPPVAASPWGIFLGRAGGIWTRAFRLMWRRVMRGRGKTRPGNRARPGGVCPISAKISSVRAPHGEVGAIPVARRWPCRFVPQWHPPQWLPPCRRSYPWRACRAPVRHH